MLQPKSLTNMEEFVSIPALCSEGFNFQSAQTIQIDMFYGFVSPSIYVQGQYSNYAVYNVRIGRIIK